MTKLGTAFNRTSAFFSATRRGEGTPLAYLGGWLGKANLGDEALYLAYKVLLPQCRLWHFDGSRSQRILLNLFPRCSNGVLAGGTLINRAGIYLDRFRQFSQNSRSAFVFGTGVADPAFWEGRSGFVSTMGDWARTLKTCKYVGVRGPLSARLLEEAGVGHVTVVGDPALAFAQDHISALPSEFTLGLNVGDDHGNQWGDPANLFEQYRQLAVLAKLAGWKIKWFVVFPKDLEITAAIAKQVEPSPDIYVNYFEPERFVEEAAKVSVFVAMKLHAAILSICAHRPTLLLEYDPKCLDFMTSILQQDATIRTDRFRAEHGFEIVKEWSGQLASRQARQSRETLRLVAYQKSEASRLFSLFTA